jgi:hypothetical protein
VFHKPFIISSEKIGKSIVHLHNVSKCNHTDWFILKNDNNDVVGSILICLTIDEV